MSGISDTFALALRHHQAGNLHLAEPLYRQILQANPAHADSHHLLGVLAYQTGRYDIAIAAIRKALALNPLAGVFHCNLGLAQTALGQLNEAVSSYQLALRFEPNCAEAHCNLGNTLLRLNDHEAAKAHYLQTLRLNPNYAEARCGLGVILQAQGQVAEAESQLLQSVALSPNYAEAHNNLANALVVLGKHDEAIAHWHRALSIRPNFFEAHNNLANTLLSLDRADDAAASYRRALAINPQLVEAHHGLGNALERLDQLDEAICCYQQALRLNPRLAEGFNNLANTLTRQHKIEEAIPSYHEALRLKPNYAEAHYNLGNALAKQGCPDLALASFRQALRLQPDLAKAQSNVLFCLNYLPGADPDAIFEEHRRWGQRTEGRGADKCGVRSAERAVQENVQCAYVRPLRIGYLSPDLRDHALIRYLEPVLTHHDRQRFEVFCFAEVARPDAVTVRLQGLVQGWRWTHKLSANDVARRIREDKIDILVDLAGHTCNNRLDVFAEKPAPVQATWLGYMNTTGLTGVDYRLTDDVLDPPGPPVRDTEELLRLPGGMCCFAPPPDAPEVGPLPASARKHLTFGSLNGLLKVNAAVLDLWASVLEAIPNARLLMFHNTLVSTAQMRIRKNFQERGIGPDRLDLRQGSCADGYLGVYSEIDVSLDTFPCTGGVTTCESLWMGVPLLSLEGVRPAGRHSATLLSRVGLSDWAVNSPEQYVAFAVRLASNLNSLADLRSGLRSRMLETICDAKQFTQVLENTYQEMWRRSVLQANEPVTCPTGP
jgi:predicted O-linked N-acetylglucosamine transferase (SPINDLY family)